MGIVDTILATAGINTDTTINVDYERASLVHNFVHTQYTAISNGQSHAQSLYNILHFAQTVNGGDHLAAIQQVALVVVGEDIRHNGTGPLWVDFSGQPHLKGADGFNFLTGTGQDDSIQMVHAVAGLFMATHAGDYGTIAAIADEMYDAIDRGLPVDESDIELYHRTAWATNLLNDPEALSALIADGTITADTLAEALRIYAFNDSVLPHTPTHECFGAGTPIDMWPLDASLEPGSDGIYDQAAVSAKIWKKPIELVEVGDTVVSFDDKGNMVPGHVPRTFQNDVKILLNFFGTRVTPGHVYYRADSKKAPKFETLIDILRDDGVIQKQDGTLIRAATNVPVGDPRDGFVKASTGTRRADGTLDEQDQGRIRLGTRFIMGEGKQRKHWSIADVIEHAGGVVGEDEMIRVGEGPAMAFHWEFGDTLPKPEDFVLEASGTSLEDIYKAAEWEGQQPQMPAPMVMDGGSVQPLPHKALNAMPRNEPLSFAPTPAAKPRQALNHKQRKAMEAKQRKAGKVKRMMS